MADWDPNNELNATVVRQWLSFSDFYHWPHVILFDSWEDLAQKLDAADFHVRAFFFAFFCSRMCLECS